MTIKPRNLGYKSVTSDGRRDNGRRYNANDTHGIFPSKEKLIQGSHIQFVGRIFLHETLSREKHRHQILCFGVIPDSHMCKML